MLHHLRIGLWFRASMVLLGISGCAGPAQRASPGPPASPVGVAEPSAHLREAGREVDVWLALIDAEQYAQSWDSASSAFRQAVTTQAWTDAARRVRSPLGRVQSRTLLSRDYTTTVPGAPPGEYIVTRYQTSFAARPMREVIILAREPDGRWRVAGYYVEPG